MIKLAYLFLIGLLLSSCAGLKQLNRQTSDQRYNAAEHTNRQESGRKKDQQSLLLRDSLHENMVMEIYPDGYFEFTVNEGFKGQASALKLTRRINKIHHLAQEKEADSLYRQSVSTAAVKKETVKHAASRRFTGQWNTGWYAALALILLFAWWYYKRE